MLKIKRIFAIFIALAVLGSSLILGINFFVILSQSKNILSVEEASQKTDTQYIMVLGCGIKDGRPSDMLEDRLLRALEVAKELPEAKLILSGNNAGPEYNEVGVMKSFCLEKGFDEKRILTDDNGFSTGASVTNLKKVFDGKRVIIVTQKYHLYRALHISSQFDLQAYGVASNQRKYKMQIYYSLREVLARNKDFVKYFAV
ncbi:MAG: YdcF family protein [Ruminococcaceae bacterium]|nr:YdcF family protein [Oscillospiraceae bacterium]